MKSLSIVMLDQTMKNKKNFEEKKFVPFQFNIIHVMKLIQVFLECNYYHFETETVGLNELNDNDI